jgi:hypothetical protein
MGRNYIIAVVRVVSRLLLAAAMYRIHGIYRLLRYIARLLCRYRLILHVWEILYMYYTLCKRLNKDYTTTLDYH